jgi:hypothetical protein
VENLLFIASAGHDQLLRVDCRIGDKIIERPRAEVGEPQRPSKRNTSDAQDDAQTTNDGHDRDREACGEKAGLDRGSKRQGTQDRIAHDSVSLDAARRFDAADWSVSLFGIIRSPPGEMIAG